MISPADLVEQELQPGERVLWRGAPDGSRWFLPQDALLIPFSLTWGGFVIFWEASVLSSRITGITVIFALFGFPFVCVGLYLILGRLFVRHWLLAGTGYALTDRRAISIAPAFRGGRVVRSVWLGSYPPIDKRTGRKARGTLWIGTFPIGPRSIMSDPAWPGVGRVMTNAVIFNDIEDPDMVYSLLSSRLGNQTGSGGLR